MLTHCGHASAGQYSDLRVAAVSTARGQDVQAICAVVDRHSCN